MKRKTVTVILVGFIIILSMLNLAFAPILDVENVHPLVGGEGVEPLGTIELKSLDYTWEPVVVEASQLTDLIGTPVNSTDVFSQDNDILVYIWNGSTELWEGIPFQVDERHPVNGSYLKDYSNGILDGLDEIVFMARDAGDRASSGEWVIGCDAPRYEVEITDPDTGDNAWAYVYKSSRIEASFADDYVRFEAGTNEVFTESYTMGFRDGIGMIMDYFNVTEAYGGDGKDLVDTLEIDIFIKFFSINFTYNENDMIEDFTLKKDGYVRALGVLNWHIYRDLLGVIVDVYFNFTWKFYPEHVNVTEQVTVSINEPMLIVNVWLALDHNATSCPIDYRDLNGNTGVINGIDSDDNIMNPNAKGWWEMSSPHGGYVCVWDLYLDGESSELKFDDNSSGTDHPNAEPGLYGRTGENYLNITHYQVSLGNISYFPIPSDVKDVAEDIAHNVTHPLLITTTAQHSPAIWVEKGIDVAFAKEGDFVNYTIFFNNTGDLDANFVWINDTLPSDVTFFGHDADTSSSSAPYFINFNQIGNTLYFEFSNVPQGVHYFNITVTVNSGVSSGEIITNWAYCNFTNNVLGVMPESSASASFEGLGPPMPNIQVEKSVDKVFALPGETLQYTIYFNNTGLGTAETVWINDSLPAEVTYLNDSSATELGIKTGDYNWTFTNIAPGDHSFVINVSLGSATVGTSIDNIVFLDYTATGSIEMPGSQAWAKIIVGNYMVLKQGWNLISVPAIQGDQSLTKVLENISGYYDAIQLYNNSDNVDKWKHYKVGKPFGNDLTEITEKMGFWIHITQPGDTIFLYNGTIPTVSPTIDIFPGWNLVGYPSLTSYNRTEGLNNLTFGSDVDSILTYDAATQKWKEIVGSNNFEMGRGYWVHAKTKCEWEVPL